VSKHPERTRRFVRASNKGWAYAMDHREETTQLIQQHYAPQKKA